MTGPLVSPAELAAALDGPRPPVLLDVRWSLQGPGGAELYAEGHLPGARFVDLDRDLAAEPGAGGRHPLPDPDAFAAAMRRAGVRQDRGVVVYDAADGSSAARAWWLLRHHGHDDVRLLDGGYAAWRAAGQPAATGAADQQGPSAGDFTAAPGRLPVLDAAAAGALARDGVLLDARAGARYRGETEPVDTVAGHIPGAVSAPATDNVGPDGRLLPAEALRARFAALGAGPGVDVGAYCGSGVTAAHAVLALQVAGITAALYPGSWSEWITDPGRPVETGDRHG